MQINIPKEVQYIIETLESRGYEAYAVGGCVRDSLLGKEPKDWDICTSALIEQTLEVFNSLNFSCNIQSLKFGTVYLNMNKDSYEITTFRIDGTYSDNRHPDFVEYITDLNKDLTRRDFTINALAYHPEKGIIDPFHCEQDLQNKIIRCVGDPNKRFQEDGLRIMRALRFAATYEFTIDSETEQAMFDHKELLRNISVERIAIELNKLLLGANAVDVLLDYVPIFIEIIPEIQPMVNFEQNNPYHCYDVLKHTLFSVGYAPRDLIIRLTMLLHDIAKPHCYTEENGIGHFHKHPKLSSEMAKNILTRLKYDHHTINQVTQLILYHDISFLPSPKFVKKWLGKLGVDSFHKLLEVRYADTMAHAEKAKNSNIPMLENVLQLFYEIKLQNQCFSIKDLDINGDDLIALGIPEGKQIGEILKQLLDLVIDEKVENKKETLLNNVECKM
jgi:tRNA nucleotidyltransferase (CCA-adding enzyme)